MLFSLLGIAVRFFSNYLESSSQVAVRSIASVFVLGVFMLLRTETFRFNWKTLHKRAFAVFCVTGVTSTTFFILSVTQIKAANSVFYLYVASFVSSFLIGSVFLKERTTVQKSMALVLAFAGLVVFSYPIQMTSVMGIAFGLLAGLSDTLHFTSQSYLKEVKRHTLLFYSYLFGGSALGLWALISHEKLLQPVSAVLVIAIVILGFLNLLLGEALLYGFNNFQLNKGTIIVAGELPFAIIVNFIVLHEVPTIAEAIGATLIFAAILISNVPMERLHRSHKTEKQHA